MKLEFVSVCPMIMTWVLSVEGHNIVDPGRDWALSLMQQLEANKHQA